MGRMSDIVARMTQAESAAWQAFRQTLEVEVSAQYGAIYKHSPGAGAQVLDNLDRDEALCEVRLQQIVDGTLAPWSAVPEAGMAFAAGSRPQRLQGRVVGAPLWVAHVEKLSDLEARYQHACAALGCSSSARGSAFRADYECDPWLREEVYDKVDHSRGMLCWGVPSAGASPLTGFTAGMMVARLGLHPVRYGRGEPLVHHRYKLPADISARVPSIADAGAFPWWRPANPATPYGQTIGGIPEVVHASHPYRDTPIREEPHVIDW